jgi:uncharacterized protein YkwD
MVVKLIHSLAQALKMHNDYRALHGAAPLQLSEELNAYAQEWAEHLAAKDVFEHRPRETRKCGENLFYGMNTQGINRMLLQYSYFRSTCEKVQ